MWLNVWLNLLKEIRHELGQFNDFRANDKIYEFQFEKLKICFV